MELGKYAETFKKEQVAGDILLELTDKELKEDLGIESKLHRLSLIMSFCFIFKSRCFQASTAEGHQLPALCKEHSCRSRSLLLKTTKQDSHLTFYIQH